MEDAGFDFNTMDFSNMGGFVTGFEGAGHQLADESAFLKTVEGNTSTGYFFGGDEGIDTTTTSFDSVFAVPHQTDYAMQQNLNLDNTLGGSSAWNTHTALSLSPATRLDDFTAPAASFDSLCQPQLNISHKRPLQLDAQDFPQLKRHEGIVDYANFSPFLASGSVTGSSWTMDPITTPSSTCDVGLTEEAADVCATWFSKYAVLPSDRHIESLSQLTGESPNAIRHWFGQMLKQGMVGHDSAYKSQTSLSQPDVSTDVSFQTSATDVACVHDTQTSNSPPAAPQGGRKGCKPTSNPDLLSRDPNKVYQCTRKCGKRYGRKCDWKRNEEEGYPSKSWKCSLCIDQGLTKVKPCFRKYHFSQHFRNIHPGLSSADYEADSVVHSDTTFPRKCGFCNHRFSSRQDRIDHIADHFKKGKCMLDWTDDEDENADSDNMDDDDDDRPDSDSFDGPSDDQQDKDTRGRPDAKHNGGGSNGPGGPRVPSGFGQFQLDQFKDSASGEQFTGLEQEEGSWDERNHAPLNDGLVQDGTEPQHQCSLQQQCSSQEKHSIQEQGRTQSESSIYKQSSSQKHSRHNKATGDDTDAMARDDVSIILTDSKLQTQTPTSKSKSTPTSRGRSQQSTEDVLVMKINGQIDQEVVGENTNPLVGHPRYATQDGGPVSIDSSLVLPVTDTALATEEIQSSGALGEGGSGSGIANSTPEIPRDRLRLLTLQGGGIRNSSLILLMEHLMGELQNEGQDSGGRARLRDFFDAIGSTSTGGLVATMLGRAGVQPAAIFNLVGDMSLASKEQLITTSRPSDFAAQPSPTPPPEPSISNRYHGSSSWATNSGMNPTMHSERALVDSETQQGQVLEEQTAKVWLADTEGLCGSRSSTLRSAESSLGRTIDNSLRPSLVQLPSLQGRQETNDAPGKTVTLNHGLPGVFSPNALNARLDSTGARSLARRQKPAFLSVKLLGTGGFSTVDEVVHRETNLRVSRKTLKNREHSAMEELRQEVNVLQKLRHPHIIRFLGAYSNGDKMSILLSPVAETTLAVWLDRCLIGKPPGLAETVVKMLGCLVSSVRYLHAQRPVVKHMDIKPQNILVVMGGNAEYPHVVLSDFGVSSSEEGPLTDRRTKALTRRYCAPEVPSGIARGQAADIWSLGCVFVEMAATAFGQDNSQWLQFRREFGGGEGKYYWQNMDELHERLAGFLDQASTRTETTVILAVTSMLNNEPTERPDAASLTMVFTPAPCCLGWTNQNASFPGPKEELDTVRMLVHENDIDCSGSGRHQFRSGAKHTLQLQSQSQPTIQARKWLDECSHHHEACRPTGDSASFLPTRLIDLIGTTQGNSASSFRIVNGTNVEHSANYVAVIPASSSTSGLTLCHGRLHQMQSHLTRDMLPGAINDAITAANSLGIRYMWVDSLCILQDSDEDKRRECAAMADVYRNAALTIVVHAAATTPFTGNTTTTTLDRAPLSSTSDDFVVDTRSWSLQERFLSRRFLHLAGEQMYWECNALKASETFPQGLPSLLWEKVHTKSPSPWFPPSMSSPSNCTRSLGTRPTGTTRLLRRTRRYDESRSPRFEAGRWRYDESRSPNHGKSTSMLGEFGSGHPCDFSFESKGGDEEGVVAMSERKAGREQVNRSGQRSGGGMDIECDDQDGHEDERRVHVATKV
ncbi:hypothetical protein K504DRAFT_462115 [Pleomassaria siparia CBS 279.74]|uniref:Protein kinase domain-containing protein n=1 Tax=Pleomassaria siparia CBS 279.74 TaxID=1314801 RepID=A0A6G1KM91_9PLEO|nr:hypothetical protein K504DRAFT_462115 [Pleomassaria siparia CBS 279.74]